MTDTTDLIARLRDNAQGISLGAEGMGWGFDEAMLNEAADALEQQAAQIEALRADAERYRWLRMRLKVREERSMSGRYKDSIYIRVAQSFFDTPTRGDDGYLDKAIFAKECCEFDAATAAVLAEREACAKVCDSKSTEGITALEPTGSDIRQIVCGTVCAAAIRARSAV